MSFAGYNHSGDLGTCETVLFKQRKVGAVSCTWVHLFIDMSCTLASTAPFYFHNVPWHLSLAGVQFVS